MNREAKVIEVVGGIIRQGDRYLLGKRPIGKAQGGLWEFIGGKIEAGETPCEALARECREEIALEIVNARVRTAVTHAYPDRAIRLTLIDCEPAPGAEPVALEHEALGWYTPSEMQSLNFCPADAALFKKLFVGSPEKRIL
jgi:8-oxo-dGTP diphosphatase